MEETSDNENSVDQSAPHEQTQISGEDNTPNTETSTAQLSKQEIDESDAGKHGNAIAAHNVSWQTTCRSCAMKFIVIHQLLPVLRYFPFDADGTTTARNIPTLLGRH